jgi:hypothetical protein
VSSGGGIECEGSESPSYHQGESWSFPLGASPTDKLTV